MYRIVGADQKEYGPVTAEQIIAWIKDGRSNGQTLARLEDGAWKPLSTFSEFAPYIPAQSVNPAPLQSASEQDAGGPPPSHLIFAVLVTTCCGCVPLGIPAVYHAAQAVAKIEAGDMAGAWVSSKKARNWCFIALLGGMVFVICYSAMMQLGYIATPRLK